MPRRGLSGVFALALAASVATTALASLISPVQASAASVPTLTFSGTGYGHGLGMSQLGAVEAANRGLTAEQIVKHYYTGTALKTLATFSVKVNLWPSASSSNKAKTSWTLKPGYYKGSLVVTPAGGAAVTYATDTTYVFTASNQVITMAYTSGGTAKSVKLGSEATVSSPKPAGTAATAPDLIQVVDASGGLGSSNVRYRGTMNVSVSSSEPNEVRLQNRLDIEQYLYGVVPRELGSAFSPKPAASQAQAIVARSYAYPATSELYCTTSSQVYGGHSSFTSTANRTAGIASALEQAAANAAVDATKGTYVSYGGSVVKTFFSGSNGTATASNEDVWGSSPLAYLRSVKDPYFVATSSTQWTQTYTGLTLGARLATKGYGPNGAGTTVWVDDIDFSYGDGGYATKATIAWSNGSLTTITLADNIRIALGTKSAQLTVENSNEITKYEESSPSVALVGSWARSATSGTSGGYHTTSKALNAYASVKFTGEGIRWIGSKGSTYGRAKVYVDGALKSTINMYRSTTARQQVLYSIGDLDPAATHELKIVVTNKAGSTAAGYVSVDRLDVVNGALVSPTYTTIENDAATIVKSGTWTTYRNSQMSGGSIAYSSSLGKGFTAKFTGNEVRWYGYKLPSGGRANVYVDGVLKKTVNFYASTTQVKKLMYYGSGFDPSKTHTVKVVILTKSGSTKAGRVSVDCLLVTNPLAQ